MCMDESRVCVRLTCVCVCISSHSFAPASAKSLTGECIHRDRWVTKTTCLLQPGPQHVDRVRQSINHTYKGHGPLMAVCL